MIRAINTASFVASLSQFVFPPAHRRPSHASTSSAVDAVMAGDADTVSESDMALSNREGNDKFPRVPCNGRAIRCPGESGGNPRRTIVSVGKNRHGDDRA